MASFRFPVCVSLAINDEASDIIAVFVLFAGFHSGKLIGQFGKAGRQVRGVLLDAMLQGADPDRQAPDALTPRRAGGRKVQ